jgi:hypothetical protein
VSPPEQRCWPFICCSLTSGAPNTLLVSTRRDLIAVHQARDSILTLPPAVSFYPWRSATGVWGTCCSLTDGAPDSLVVCIWRELVVVRKVRDYMFTLFTGCSFAMALLGTSTFTFVANNASPRRYEHCFYKGDKRVDGGDRVRVGMSTLLLIVPTSVAPLVALLFALGRVMHLHENMSVFSIE